MQLMPLKGLMKGIMGGGGGMEQAPVVDDVDTAFDDEDEDGEEYVPLVLVIGATGRTGKIITRKLAMQGFRVAVLVRSLSSSVIDQLPSGVSYSYGDMTNYRALLDAMEDVDRIVFAADGEDEERELLGLSNIVRSFQDTRTFMYGDAEATKLSLLKMRKDSDFNRWAVEDTKEAAAFRIAQDGVGPRTSFAYWKRSPTGAHKNGIFVGKVFDTFLGSASVACSLSGLLVGPPPAVLALGSQAAGAAGEEAQQQQQQQQQKALGAGGAADSPTAAPSPDGADVRSAEIDRAVAAAAADTVPLNLGEYSGLVVRAIGDGQKYTVVVRTPEYARQGIEYHADFPTVPTNFESVRLPFSSFVAVRGGRPIAGAPELDRRSLVGLALAFYPQRNTPEDPQMTGEFYVSLVHVKAYRKRDEPEFVYLSDAAAADVVAEEEARTPGRQTALSAEAAAASTAPEVASAASAASAAAEAAAAASAAAAATAAAAAGRRQQRARGRCGRRGALGRRARAEAARGHQGQGRGAAAVVGPDVLHRARDRPR